ncbi:DUF4357 domain-containing protein [Salicibibacter kimchii]|uniref:DUF4357 domain-containing protein n=1 Tax=Salicibibacter kimchii TaxID=2099786 RepID=A0A345BXB0_9BACI|nr:DUF4357 domain-containing protein [Salicibibacter kimchii]AXF55591.1 DUF4357 domain-containing protein [Salicibibacter kimchii]
MGDDLFYCEGKGVKARGQYTEEGFVIFQGSQMVEEVINSASNWVSEKREALIADGVATFKTDHYEFLEDHRFPSPSQAAAVVKGGNTNGWTAWKNKKGITLNKIYRSE